MIIDFKGNKYQIDKEYWVGDMVNNSTQFQFDQLKYCQEIGDYTTLEHRINNMLKWGGIKQIKQEEITDESDIFTFN